MAGRRSGVWWFIAVCIARKKTASATPELMAQSGNEELLFEIVQEGEVSYEYAVYVTNLEFPASAIGCLYRSRRDNENCYDEFKNQWGWGGFSVQDLGRCALMANIVAYIYNLWRVYAKFVNEKVAREAITSHPNFLEHMAKSRKHQCQKTVQILCVHGLGEPIRKLLERARELLSEWKEKAKNLIFVQRGCVAEQSGQPSIWRQVIEHILLKHRTIGVGKVPEELVSG